MEKKMFFFPCHNCYTKLVNDITEVGQIRVCSGCKEKIPVPKPPARIPPFAVIKSIMHSPKTNSKYLIISCPYCGNNQKVAPQHCGKKIYCECCKIVIEIPVYATTELKLSLSQDTVSADGKNIVVITAETCDSKGIPIPKQKINFVIERERGSKSEVSEVTNDIGKAVIGYTTTIYSGKTNIKAILDADKNTFQEVVLKEIDGIGDGKLVIKTIDFQPLEEGEYKLKGELVVHNPGKDLILIEKISIDPMDYEKNEIIDFENWHALIEHELGGTEQHKFSFVLYKRHNKPIQEYLKMKCSLVATNQKTNKTLEVTKGVLVTLQTVSSLEFKVATTNNNIEKAGRPFGLVLTAMRNQRIDKNVSDGLELQFKCNAQNSPNNNIPKLILNETVFFENGLGKTSEGFCFFNQEQGVIIEVYCKNQVRGEIYNLKVCASETPEFLFDLASPQINNEALSGNNTITIHDTYGNVMKDFKEPIFISLSNGILKKDAKKVATQLVPENGVIDLTKNALIPSLNKEDFSSESNLILKYQDIKQTSKWKIDPKPLQIDIEKILFSQSTIEQQNSGSISVLLSKMEHSNYKLVSANLEWHHKNDKTIANHNINTTNLQIKEQQVDISFYIDETFKCGDFGVKVFLEIEDCFYQKILKVESEVTYGLSIESRNRTLQITSDENTIAGNSIKLKIVALYDNEKDINYTGSKTILIKSKSLIEKEHIPQKETIVFEKGEAFLDTLVFYKSHKPKICFFDDANNNTQGEILLDILPGAVDKLDVCIQTQKNHSLLAGENYLIVKDLYDNIVTNFCEDIEIKGVNFELSKELPYVIPRKFFENGRVDLNLCGLKIHKPLEEKSAQILVCYKNVETNCFIDIVPVSDIVMVENFNSAMKEIEPGQEINIEFSLVNTGETIQKITEISVDFLSQDKNIFHQSPISQISMNIKDSCLEPKQTWNKKTMVTFPENVPCEEVQVYLCIQTKDTFTGEEIAYTYNKYIPVVSTHKERHLKIILPEKIIAGEVFSIPLEIHKDGDIDNSFNGNFKTLFLISPNNKSASVFPKEFNILFNHGKGSTPNLFYLFSCEIDYSIEVKVLWKKEIAQEIDLPKCVPGAVSKLILNYTSKQIANQPFLGKFIITAKDEFDNTKNDFSEEVTIESSGEGSIQKNNMSLVIKKECFKNGIVEVPANEISYISSQLQRPEKIDIIVKSSTCENNYALEIMPPPAVLKIVDINVSNEKVQWEENNYLIFLKLQNVGGSIANLVSIDLEFTHNKQIQEQGYSIIVQKSLPKVPYNEIVNVSIMVGLEKNVPIGKHSITAKVKYEDSCYQTEECIEKSGKSWHVEPSGREIVYTPVAETHAWKPFALELMVQLNGKIDTTYSGTHIFLCTLKNMQNLKEQYVIPRNLELNFEKGKSKTNEVFTVYEKVDDIQLEFYETEIGGASGKISIGVQSELLAHKLQRYLQKFLFFCKQHKRRLIQLGLLLLVILTLFTHWSSVKATQILQVAKINGKATVEGRELKEGDIIFQYQNIEVAENGFCVLETKNGGTFKLYGSTNVQVNALGRGFVSSEYDNSLEVKNGDVSYYNTQKNANFPQINMPYVDQINIESTDFRVGVKNDTSLLSVYEGKATITAQGEPVEVTKGKGSSVTKGQPPTEAKALPIAPTWMEPKDGATIEATSIFLKWLAVDGINHYNMEICKEDMPSLPVLSNDIKNSNTYKVRGLGNGNFQCLISSIDETGFVSPPSIPRKFIHDVKEYKSELRVNVTDNDNISVDSFWIGDKEYKNGSELPPGEYLISIKKDGYKNYNVKIIIDAQQPFIAIDSKLELKKRLLDWQIKPDVDIEVDYNIKEILQNGKKINELPSEILPGAYDIKMDVDGFDLFEKNIEIQPGEEKQTVTIILNTKERNIVNQIKTNITTDKPIVYKLDESINPQTIKPGSYRLQIECPGFVIINEPIIIEPSSQEFIIENAIQAKKREVVFSLSEKVSTVQKLNAINDKNEQEQFSLNEKQMIMPGKWKLSLDIPDYTNVSEDIFIKPDNLVYNHTFSITSKRVPVKINLKLPYPTDNISIDLVSKEGNITFPYEPVIALEPGTYQITIKAYGYKPNKINITVIRDQKNLHSIVLEPKEVLINPFIIDRENGFRTKLLAIMYQGQQITEPFLLPPGIIDVKLQSQGYGEVSAQLKIALSENPYQIQTNIVREERELSFNIAKFLQKYNVNYSNEYFEIDQEFYRIEIQENSIRDISPQKIKNYSLSKYFTLKSSVHAQQIKFRIGYHYAVYSLDQYQEMSPLIFTHIDWPLFLNHLKKIKNESLRTQRLLTILENKDQLQKPQEQEIKEIKNYILKWNKPLLEIETWLKKLETWK